MARTSRAALVQSSVADKSKHVYTIETDYGETKAFEKIS